MFRVLGLPKSVNNHYQLVYFKVRSWAFGITKLSGFDLPQEVVFSSAQVAELGDEALCLQGQKLRSCLVGRRRYRDDLQKIMMIMWENDIKHVKHDVKLSECWYHFREMPCVVVTLTIAMRHAHLASCLRLGG